MHKEEGEWDERPALALSPERLHTGYGMSFWPSDLLAGS